jgi:hypothetical protein
MQAYQQSALANTSGTYLSATSAITVCIAGNLIAQPDPYCRLGKAVQWPAYFAQEARMYSETEQSMSEDQKGGVVACMP